MRDGWLVTSLDETADVIMGQSPEGKSYNEAGDGIPFMQGSGEFGAHHPIPKQWCSAPKKIAQPGDLLLSVRAPVGDTNFADQRIAVGRGLSVIRANAKSSNEFLRLVIQFNVSEMISSSGTGMFSSITGKNLKGFKVVLPPLPEQKRIVDLASSVDSYIEALRQQLEKANRSRSAVLHELLTAGGDGWTETTFREFARLEKGISYKSSELCDENQGLPFINLKSIDRGGGYRRDGLKWYSGKYKSSQVVEPRDLILCCTDLTKQKAILGYPILVPDIGFSKFAISLDLAKVIVNEEVVLRSFLFLLLQGNRMREFMQSRSSGTTVMHLKTSEVPQLQVSLPPLAEQKRIVDLISTVDSYIEAIERQIASTMSLRSGLLSDLLSGDHEIPASYDQLIGAA